MIEILLIFSLNGQPSSVSERIFTSFNECKQFVNTLAEDDVVKRDGTFTFMASDGGVFRGQCVDRQKYEESKEI